MKKLYYLLALLTISTVLLAQTPVCFSPAVPFAVGTQPQSVTSADFDGDGKVDLAIANYSSNNVSVLMNNGAGGFVAAVNYTVGTNPTSVTSADFNGDGKADLAIANWSSNNVSVLMNNGTGGFVAAINYMVGTQPQSVTSADFNGDGKADLATANYGPDNVSVLMNNGTGGFATAVNYAVGSNPFSVTSADFNGDGKADLAIANQASYNVSVLINNGVGTLLSFAAAVNYAVSSNAFSITSADFNGDGKTDLAVATYMSNKVAVLLNNGIGTTLSFATAVNYAVGTYAFSVTSDDFNGDGKADLAVANQESHNVSVLINNGVGTSLSFAAAVNYAVGSYPSSVTSADFNGDGEADLAITNQGGSNLSVLMSIAISAQPSNVSQCSGTTATFSVGVTLPPPGLAYQWQQKIGLNAFANIGNGGIYSGATEPTLTITGITAGMTGYKYRCIVGSCSPSLSSAEAELTVFQSSISLQPADIAKCEGLTVNLTTSTSNAFGVYQWQIDTGSGFVDMVSNSEHPDVNSQSLSFSALPSQNGNKYRLRVGNCTPSVFSDEAAVTVYATPAITTQPVAATICSGDNATFTVAATGASLMYQWRVGGLDITDNSLYSGATTSQLTITGASALLTGNEYTCTITGATGCIAVGTISAVLTVNQIQITDSPVQPVQICSGGNASFSVTATGPSLTYQWQEDSGSGFVNLSNGGVYSGATTSLLTLTNVPFSMNSLQYRCVVSSTCTDVNSLSAQLKLFPTPAKPIVSVNFSNPESPVLSASGGSTYQWFKNGAALSGATSSSYTISSKGLYTVQITINGCLSPMSDQNVIIVTGDLQEDSYPVAQVYPNPVEGILFLQLTGFGPAKLVDIELMDGTGRSMMSLQKKGEAESQIDMTYFSGGIYFVRMVQDGRIQLVRFVKK
ncbi:hypothetical protein MASR2M41_02810 [Flammeovirgaceae bacterium]